MKEELRQSEEAASENSNESALRAELSSLRDQLASRDQTLEEASQEREALRQQIENEKSDNSRVVALEAELAEAQRELANLDQASSSETSPEGSGGHPTIGAEEPSALEQERDALEAELEQVRNHAAELNETVVEQQREIDEHKSELGGEIQQLRRLVEEQADMFSTQKGKEESARKQPPAKAEAKAEQSSRSDPVVESVMAQFAKLQKDAAQRRRKN